MKLLELCLHCCACLAAEFLYSSCTWCSHSTVQRERKPDKLEVMAEKKQNKLEVKAGSLARTGERGPDNT